MATPDFKRSFLQHHILAMSTLSPPSNALQVVHITSITAALARLNLKISTDDILDVIQEEEEVRNNKLIVLSGCKSGPIPHPISDNVHSQSLSDPQTHSLLSASSFPTLAIPPIPSHQQTNTLAFYSNSLKRRPPTARFRIRSCRFRGSNQSRRSEPRSSPSSGRHVLS